jgi:hypothetical protein
MKTEREKKNRKQKLKLGAARGLFSATAHFI